MMSNGQEDGKNQQQQQMGQPKRILVTGGAGYIGSHTCVELLNNGFDVVVMDDFTNSGNECLRRVEKITGRRVDYHMVDLCNIDSLELIFKREKFDAVIHFAGLKAVGESVEQPLRYYHNNLVSTMNLIAVMDKYNCNNLVFSSSATVYANAEPPIPETAPLQATSPYGRTKLFAEDILRDVANSPSGRKWRIVLLRYFNPVGAHPSGLIGEDPVGTPNNLMPYITQVAVGRREQLSIFGNDYPSPDGTGVRDYIHVMDLASGHVAALREVIFGTAGKSNCEVFNLGTGKGVSVLDLVFAFSRASGINIPYKVVGRRPGDIALSYADVKKANDVLKWHAEYDIDRMCEDSWRWQKNNPLGYRNSH